MAPAALLLKEGDVILLKASPIFAVAPVVPGTFHTYGGRSMVPGPLATDGLANVAVVVMVVFLAGITTFAAAYTAAVVVVAFTAGVAATFLVLGVGAREILP